MIFFTQNIGLICLYGQISMLLGTTATTTSTTLDQPTQQDRNSVLNPHLCYPSRAGSGELGPSLLGQPQLRLRQSEGWSSMRSWPLQWTNHCQQLTTQLQGWGQSHITVKELLTLYEGKVGRSSDLVYVHQVLGRIRGNTPWRFICDSSE